MSLKQRLEAIKKSFAKQVPEGSPAPGIMHRVTQSLIDSGQACRAVGEGGEFPDFRLPDPSGVLHARGDGVTVVTFFRGRW
ncbi:MAG: hypothetical protein ACYTHK_16425 [Planctomycetota bacterium]|jgi:hypothetical protein